MLGMQETCGLNNPWFHLKRCHNWVEISGRPPHTTPRVRQDEIKSTLSAGGNYEPESVFLKILNTVLRSYGSSFRSVLNQTKQELKTVLNVFF